MTHLEQRTCEERVLRPGRSFGEMHEWPVALTLAYLELLPAATAAERFGAWPMPHRTLPPVSVADCDEFAGTPEHDA